MNLVEHLIRQLTFSAKTFGPGTRLGGVSDHIRKELIELGGPPDELETAVLTGNIALARRIATARAVKRGGVEKIGDPAEWVDVVLLALDGMWRAVDHEAGHMLTPEQIARIICHNIEAKQTKNEGRDWPDWRKASPDKAIEHDRSSE